MRRHTSIEIGYAVVDELLGVFLERLAHVWKRRKPFECVSKVAVRADGAEIAAFGGDGAVEALTYLVGGE